MPASCRKGKEPAKASPEEKRPPKRHQRGQLEGKVAKEMKDPASDDEANNGILDDSESDSDATPANGNGEAQVRSARKTRNETANRSHNVRVDVKTLVPADDAADKRLTQVIKAVLHQLKSNHVDLLVKP